MLPIAGSSRPAREETRAPAVEGSAEVAVTAAATGVAASLAEGKGAVEGGRVVREAAVATMAAGETSGVTEAAGAIAGAAAKTTVSTEAGATAGAAAAAVTAGAATEAVAEAAAKVNAGPAEAAEVGVGAVAGLGPRPAHWQHMNKKQKLKWKLRRKQKSAQGH